MAEMSSGDRVDTRLSELLDEHRAWLRRTVERLCPRQLGISPDEVEQDVRLRLWRALERGTTIESPTSYLYRAASSATIDAIRRLKARREDSLDADDPSTPEPPSLEDPGADPHRRLEGVERASTIRDALAKLIPNRRRAVALHLQGFDNREICRLLDWTEAKTRNLVSRGMRDLREVLATRSSEP